MCTNHSKLMVCHADLVNLIFFRKGHFHNGGTTKGTLYTKTAGILGSLMREPLLPAVVLG